MVKQLMCVYIADQFQILNTTVLRVKYFILQHVSSHFKSQGLVMGLVPVWIDCLLKPTSAITYTGYSEVTCHPQISGT